MNPERRNEEFGKNLPINTAQYHSRWWSQQILAHPGLSRPSWITNQTTPSEAIASTHQAPEQNAGRRQFDEAVDPERGQGQATGDDARADRHPANRRSWVS
jgi:hypothetical protein